MFLVNPRLRSPSILHAASDLFNSSIPLHATMWALFFSLLSSPFYANQIWFPITRDKSPLRLSQGRICFSLPQALTFSASKTIQCQQHALDLPIPSIPGSRHCLISVLCRHLSLNPGPSSAPLFTVLSGSGLEPLLTSNFQGFFHW